MPYNNEYLKLITSTVKKDWAQIRPKGRNNKQVEEFTAALKIKKNDVARLTDTFVKRKAVEDTGYLTLEDGIIIKQGILAKPFDSHNAEQKFNQKRITSRYTHEGKLLNREIEKQNDICLSTEKTISSVYNEDGSALTQVNSTKNGFKIQKTIRKGMPKRIVTTSSQTKGVYGLENTISEKYIYSHLNKSPIRYMESSFKQIENEGQISNKLLRKTVLFKNGTKLQTGIHNGQPILVEIPPKGKGSVVIHKNKEDINKLLDQCDLEVQRFLS